MCVMVEDVYDAAKCFQCSEVRAMLRDACHGQRCLQCSEMRAMLRDVLNDGRNSDIHSQA